MRYNNKLLFAFVVLLGVAIVSCEKDNKIVTPNLAEFASDATVGNYYINDNPNTVFKIPVGFSTVSNAARTINFSVTSPTGAVEGQQYTLGANSITIPAGTAVDSIALKGIFAGYAGGRKDTLVFTITGGDATPFGGDEVYKVVLQQRCDVVLDDLIGLYTNSNEVWGANSYGPYETAISSVTQTSATSGTIVVENIYDYGWNAVTFKVDWSNPDNVTVKVVPQSAGIANAGTLSSAYAGEEVAVTEFPGQAGSLNMCEQKIVLKMAIGIAGIGFYSDLYQLTMQR
jgi:hypothetical protein